MAAKLIFGGPNFTRQQGGGGYTWDSGTMDRLRVATGGHRGNGANELGSSSNNNCARSLEEGQRSAGPPRDVRAQKGVAAPLSGASSLRHRRTTVATVKLEGSSPHIPRTPGDRGAKLLADAQRMAKATSKQTLGRLLPEGEDSRDITIKRL
ncbi:hypothetical protein Acr_23g0011740 [Actinidia rufa]|uniref:Uncharacterized protein n=1 Tax=Actinidia rufa TaxID=165716 RepID=A0A7J0GPR1_9ERIC|nr:hypothetical protein Acr_23g0011740 [Actinidia rufa]